MVSPPVPSFCLSVADLGIDGITPNFSHSLSTALGFVTHLGDPGEVFYSSVVNLKEIWVWFKIQDD